jgi:curved DNA-binding protein CbpA
MSTYYELLGLAPKASETEIRSAYARDMLGLQGSIHPKAAQFRGALDEAFATLIDPERRRAYDEELRRPKPKPPKPPRVPKAPKVPKPPKAPKAAKVATAPKVAAAATVAAKQAKVKSREATATSAAILPADPAQQAASYVRNGGLAFALGSLISAITYVFSIGPYLLAWAPLLAGLIGLAWWGGRYLRIPKGVWRPDHVLLLGGLVLFGIVSAGWVSLAATSP